MKSRNLLFVALLAIIVVSSHPAVAQKSGLVNDTVTLGPGYANEVYYSMSSGTKATVARNQWDIAFRTPILSSSIITNDGSGVMLYTYPKADTAGWSNLDTTGISTLEPLYNSLKDWELGAFNTFSKGQFDYGWGLYNITTHNLTGDSLYVIKLRNGVYRKLWIVQKLSSLNKYNIRYAALDGTGDVTATIDCGLYTTHNFVGFSIADSKVVDFETTAATSWDLLFTKYMGLSGTTPYPVTGVLSNDKVGVIKSHTVFLTYSQWDPALFNTAREVVGYDWKTFTGTAYKIVDSLVYFVQDKSGNINRLIFKDFAGSSTGRIVLQKEKISVLGIDEITANKMNAVVYPNPVKDIANLVINPGNSSSVKVYVMDTRGRVVLNSTFKARENTLSTLQIALPQLADGIYLVVINTESGRITQKIIVKN